MIFKPRIKPQILILMKLSTSDAISCLPTQNLMEIVWIFRCQAEWLLFIVNQ